MTTILDRRIFLVLLTAAIVCTVVAVSGVHYDYVPTAKWLNTASGLYGLSAIFKLVRLDGSRGYWKSMAMARSSRTALRHISRAR